MIKIHILAVGKLKKSYFADAAKEYLKRLSRFAAVDVQEIEASDLKKEGERLVRLYRGHAIAMCVEGDEASSERFAEKLGRLKGEGAEITFVVGCAEVISEEEKAGGEESMSLSYMSLPHEMARVVLLEQIYRAFTICEGGKYHK